MFSTQRGRIPSEQDEFVLFLHHQGQWGSVIRKSLPQKCLCESSILNINSTTLLYLVKELNLSQLNPCAVCLMEVTSLTKGDDVFKQLSTSKEDPTKDFY